MCMLCVIPPNVLPSRDKLMYSAINNPDGFGYAIVISSEKRILVEHTLDPDEAVNRFLELRGKYPDDYAMWHARFATHGLISLANCHPFRVVDEQTVVAHNGILPIDISAGDSRSDTRIFTEEVLSKMGGVVALDNPHMYNMIEEYTAGSKLCVLTVDPRAEYQMYLLHADKGAEDDSKVWWSNDSCNADYGYARWTPSKSYGSFLSDVNPYANENEEGMYTCCTCQALIDEEMLSDTAICPMCNTCQWCDMYEGSCMCYKPIKSTPNTYQTAWEM